ncbi:MAG: GNAT family N-acetyltransferase [Pirellulales bacterium]|nr:GNAT family N-acetyltransferase [Pirellulales bacterium]
MSVVIEPAPPARDEASTCFDRVVVLPARELDDDLLAIWREITAARPTLAGPFFQPEFTRLVAEHRDDVLVAVLELSGEPVGFFPYQRTRSGAGRPVGGPLSDYQAVIAASPWRGNAPRLVRACRLTSWDFDHLLAEEQAFASFCWGAAVSPCIDLADGFEAYVAQRAAAGTDVIPKARRAARVLERDLGPLRLELRDTNPAVLDALFRWKAEQFARTDLVNTFAVPWIERLLRQIAVMQTSGFSGMVTTLYAGDRLAAIIFGLRSGPVLHNWIFAFDRELSKHSPGMVLLVKLVEASPALGIQCIDLGKGPEQYKARVTNSAVALVEGSVDLRLVRPLVRRGVRAMRNIVHDPRFSPWLRTPLRLYRHLRAKSDLR